MRDRSQSKSAVSLCTNGVCKQHSSRCQGTRCQVSKEVLVCSMEPPIARMGASLSGSEDGRRVWLFGGNAGGASLNDLYCLELETRTWSQVLISCWNELKSSPYAAQAVPLPFILPSHNGLLAFVICWLMAAACSSWVGLNSKCSAQLEHAAGTKASVRKARPRSTNTLPSSSGHEAAAVQLYATDG